MIQARPSFWVMPCVPSVEAFAARLSFLVNVSVASLSIFESSYQAHETVHVLATMFIVLTILDGRPRRTYAASHDQDAMVVIVIDAQVVDVVRVMDVAHRDSRRALSKFRNK